MRITGMASGLEVDEMVKELMEAEKTRLYSYQQDKEYINWQQEAYNSVSEKYADFILSIRESFGFSSTTMIGHVDPSKVNNLSWTKQATISNTSALGINATQSAANGTYKIGINRLAENFSKVSNAAISADSTATNVVDRFGLLSTNDKIEFSIETVKNGVTESQVFSYADDPNTADVNELESVSLSQIVKDINDADLGVTATYDSTLDRIFFQTDSTGTDSKVTITDTSEFYEADGVTSRVDGVDGFLAGTNTFSKLGITSGLEYTGVNALFSYNGVENIEQSSNTFTMNGIDFDFKATTTEDVVVNISTDTDAMYDKVKDFVDKYNDMMGFANTLVQQKKARSFDPLTEKEKEELSESEIETYMKKAKVGVISNDITINSITAELRNAIVSQVGDIGYLNEIGITNAPASAGGKLGKLEIDEDKLRAALSDDPDKVMNLLFKEPEDSSLVNQYEKNLTSDQVATKRAESGIFNRVSDILSNGITNLIGKAGYGSDDSKYRSVNGEIMLNFTLRYQSIAALDNRKTQLSTKIDQLNDRMKTIEDNYFKMFAKMEASLSKMNSQSAWLQSNMM
jgi:flagellar hook-associated protein 2